MLISLWVLIAMRYIIENGLISTFQYKFDCANPSSHSWDINKQSFYSYWWPDILVVCCCFYTSYICVDSPHLGLSVKFTNSRLSFSLFSFLFSFFILIYFLLFLFLEHKVRVNDGHKSQDAWKDIEGSRAKWCHTTWIPHVGLILNT